MEETGFFQTFNNVVLEITKYLESKGEGELAATFSKITGQIESLVKNLNEGLYSSYKLSFNLLETSCNIPENTKEELKANLVKLINIYEGKN